MSVTQVYAVCQIYRLIILRFAHFTVCKVYLKKEKNYKKLKQVETHCSAGGEHLSVYWVENSAHHLLNAQQMLFKLQILSITTKPLNAIHIIMQTWNLIFKKFEIDMKSV